MITSTLWEWSRTTGAVMKRISKEEFDDAVAPQLLADLIASAMVTYLVVDDKIPEWQDWLRARLIANDNGDDPEMRRMFQVISHAPQDVIEDAVEMFVRTRREVSRQATQIWEGLPNERA